MGVSRNLMPTKIAKSPRWHLRNDGRTYHDIRKSVMDDLRMNLSYRQILEKEKITREELNGHLGWAKGQKHRMMAIGDLEHLKELERDAWLAMHAGILDNSDYNRAKSAGIFLKGIGKLKSGGQEAAPIQGISQTTINILQVYQGMSHEEREKLREEYRKAITGGPRGDRVIRSLTMGSGQDQERTTVLAQEIHSDL